MGFRRLARTAGTNAAVIAVTSVSTARATVNGRPGRGLPLRRSTTFHEMPPRLDGSCRSNCIPVDVGLASVGELNLTWNRLRVALHVEQTQTLFVAL